MGGYKLGIVNFLFVKKMKLLFPTVVHEFFVPHFPESRDRIIKYVYEERRKDVEGVDYSNVAGWQSQPNYCESNTPVRQLLHQPLIDYLYKRDVVEEDRKIFNYNGLWININGKGNFNSPHNHPGCHMSGVLWIKTPPNCGNISFQSPHSFTQANEMSRYKEEFRARTNAYPAYDFAPREGSIILFPASIMHKVNPNQSDEDRISLAFNISFSV